MICGEVIPLIRNSVVQTASGARSGRVNHVLIDEILMRVEDHKQTLVGKFVHALYGDGATAVEGKMGSHLDVRKQYYLY